MISRPSTIAVRNSGSSVARAQGHPQIFQTKHPVVIYPASGTGAWEAALSNTLSPGDHVLMYETGHFAALWQKLAARLGIKTEVLGLPGLEGWRKGVQAHLIEERLKADKEHAIKAVCVVHNETSTGVTSNIQAVRRAIDAAKHPALLLVDSISGLASAEYKHDEWGVDVTISGSQKGLMLPPVISFNRPVAQGHRGQQGPRSCPILLGLGRDRREEQDGLLALHAQHHLLYACPRRATCCLTRTSAASSTFAGTAAGRGRARRRQAWCLEIQCNEAASHSPVLTGVITPEGGTRCRAH